MTKQRKAWVFDTAKRAKASLPGTLKDEVDTRAGELIEKTLKPRHIKPPPEGSQFNYITDIKAKWSSCHISDAGSPRIVTWPLAKN